jgi:hypothetical protein
VVGGAASEVGGWFVGGDDVDLDRSSAVLGDLLTGAGTCEVSGVLGSRQRVVQADSPQHSNVLGPIHPAASGGHHRSTQR